MSACRCDEMFAHTHTFLEIMNLLRDPSLSVYATAARAASGCDTAACFSSSVAVATVRDMVKQGGSET